MSKHPVRTIQQCPFCHKMHDSDDHDVDWYFVCCGGPRLVWRVVDGSLELQPVEEDMDER